MAQKSTPNETFPMLQKGTMKARLKNERSNIEGRKCNGSVARSHKQHSTFNGFSTTHVRWQLSKFFWYSILMLIFTCSIAHRCITTTCTLGCLRCYRIYQWSVTLQTLEMNLRYTQLHVCKYNNSIKYNWCRRLYVQACLTPSLYLA